MYDKLQNDFLHAAKDVDAACLRYVHEDDEILTVRQDVPEPVYRSEDAGAMITVIHDGGLGYAATSDLRADALADAVQRAKAFAVATAGRSVTDFAAIDLPDTQADHEGPAGESWNNATLAEKLDLLAKACSSLNVDDRIVDYEASLWHIETESLLLTTTGGRIRQHYHYIAPSLQATANAGSVTQTRSLGSLRGTCRQGGMGLLETIGFGTEGPRVAREAIALLDAPDCPTGKMDLVLASDQMMLQIHESIGHPLELDRILGDERNYAGTSFVTPEMFGRYRYGSDLLNVTFDPTRPEQFATYAYDDDGQPAEKQFVIREGILQRGLGSTTSQTRSGLAGVANSRACSWNRPPIDRMANLNVEPGEKTFEQLIAGIERGVYMQTNRSWSIDDSRNKFQFGCEIGRLIENGKLTDIVRNPNYRGISATFWRSLAGVGDESTYGIFGTPHCGKGEPNQAIRVGHASPACHFADVDVFGGA